jgi:hypothetical protein
VTAASLSCTFCLCVASTAQAAPGDPDPALTGDGRQITDVGDFDFDGCVVGYGLAFLLDHAILAAGTTFGGGGAFAPARHRSGLGPRAPPTPVANSPPEPDAYVALINACAVGGG